MTRRDPRAVLGAALIALLLAALAACREPPAERPGAAADDPAVRAVEAHLRRARAAAEAGDFDMAFEALGRARELRPRDPEIQREAMEARVLRAASSASAVDGASAADLAYALRVLEEEAPDAHVAARRVVAGRLALHRGEAAAAARHLEHALEADPEQIGALNDLGVLYLGQGRSEDAAAVLRRAVAARDNAASRLNLAAAVAALEGPVPALEHLKQAAALAPDSVEVQRQLADAARALGRMDEAEAAIRKALELERDPMTLLSLGNLYYQQRDFDKAAAVFARVVEARPDLHAALFRLAVSLQRTGRGPDAAKAYRVYLERAARAPGEERRAALAREALGALAAAQNEEAAP